MFFPFSHWIFPFGNYELNRGNKHSSLVVTTYLENPRPMRNLYITLFLVSALVFSCRHEIPLNNPATGGGGTGGGGTGSSTCSADTVYFVNTILPLITSSCAQPLCHDAITHEEDLVLNNYSGIMKIVLPGNAGQSKLYEVIIKQDPGDVMPPPPNPRLSASSIAAIQKWINQGAKNNECTGACDTTQYTYGGAITGIMNTYCKGCHNPASLGGGIDLSNYFSVRSAAVSGKLLGSVKQLSGFKPMPQGSRLSDCQVVQIEKWIQAGMLNN